MNANGWTLASFGTGGKVLSSSLPNGITALGLYQARDGAGAAAVQANGQVVVGGAHFFGTSLFGLGRVNPDGTLDAGFGSGGVLTTTINGNDDVQAILIQPEGKMLAVGNSANNATGQSFFVLARYIP